MWNMKLAFTELVSAWLLWWSRLLVFPWEWKLGGWSGRVNRTKLSGKLVNEDTAFWGQISPLGSVSGSATMHLSVVIHCHLRCFLLLLDTFIFMLRLCLVPSPSVSKLCSINLATLLLTHCSAWLRALGYRCQHPAINKRSQTIAAGERAAHHRTDPVLLTGPTSSPHCRQDTCYFWSGAFAAVMELFGLLWPSSPASCRAWRLWSHRASVSGLDKAPSDKWAAIAWFAY